MSWKFVKKYCNDFKKICIDKNGFRKCSFKIID